ncbi:MAG TPA: ABC transporter ATP-binding protein [Chloroflexota bacterium]
MAVLMAENLTKRFGTGSAAVTALRDVTLSIAESEFVAIMGPSGCGKSTLLHLLGGLDRPTSGRVLLDGTDLLSLDDKALSLLRRRRIGFVFQFFNLIPVLSAAENVALPLLLDGKQNEAQARAGKWLERVGLGDRADSRPSQLSGGEQQRVAIARALVTEPSILLADEPTGNLDSRAADDLLQILRRSADEWGRAVVMVTHDARMAAYADRIVFMRDGTVVDDARMGSRQPADADSARVSARK